MSYEGDPLGIAEAFERLEAEEQEQGKPQLPPVELGPVRIFLPMTCSRRHPNGGDSWSLELPPTAGVMVPDLLIAEGYDAAGLVRQLWWHTRPLLAVPLWAVQLDLHALERPRLDPALLLPPPAECRLFHAWSSGTIERLSLGLLRLEVDAAAGRLRDDEVGLSPALDEAAPTT